MGLMFNLGRVLMVKMKSYMHCTSLGLARSSSLGEGKMAYNERVISWNWLGPTGKCY